MADLALVLLIMQTVTFCIDRFILPRRFQVTLPVICFQIMTYQIELAKAMTEYRFFFAFFSRKMH